MEKELDTAALAGSKVILKPLIRLLLSCGVTWQRFAEMAKSVYAEVALAEFGLRGRPTNLSRAAILTGIDRHELSRIKARLAEGAVTGAPRFAGSATRVLSGWHQDPDFLDEEGRPGVLPHEGAEGSFAALCHKYAGDVPVSALLKELRKSGAVIDQGGHLRAVSRNFIPRALEPEKVAVGTSLIRDHAHTVVFDLLAGPRDRPRFARRAHNARLPKDQVKPFSEFLEAEAQALLVRVDDWLTEHEVDQVAGDDELVRLGAGVFQIQDDKP